MHATTQFISLRISKLSNAMRYFSLSALFIAPLLIAMSWINDAEPLLPGMSSFLPSAITQNPHFRSVYQLDPLWKLLGFAVNLIPTAILMLVMGLLAKLFRLFAQMQFFTQESVQCIRQIGITLLCGELLYPVYVALLSLVLTISNPVGTRFIAVELGFHEIAMIAVASGIILVSWVMEEGRKLQEEQDHTI